MITSFTGCVAVWLRVHIVKAIAKPPHIAKAVWKAPPYNPHKIE